MAFVGNVNHLFRGNLDMYIAPHTAAGAVALPPHTSVGYNGNWTTGGLGWASVGFKQAPIKISHSPEYFDFMVEESTAPVRRGIKGRKISIETALAEFTMQSLSWAFGGASFVTLAGATPAPNGRPMQQLCVTAAGCSTAMYSVGFEGVDCRNPGCLLRLYVPAANITIDGDIEFSQLTDNYASIPIKVEVLSWNGNLICWQKEVCTP